VRAKLGRVFEWRVWHLYLLAGVASVVILLVGISMLLGTLYLRGQSRKETQRNAAVNRVQGRALANLKRIQVLEHPKPPSDAQLARAASRALQVCVADPKCRAQLRGSIRRTDLRPSDVPRLRPRRSSSSTGGGAGSGSTSRSGGSTGPPSAGPSRPPSSAPTPRRPQAPRPNRPAPGPSSPPSSPAPGPGPASPSPPRPTPPAPRPAPAAPTPPVSVPPVTPPPAPPPVTVPPITVPPVTPPVQVCTPVVQVNCQRANGRVVGPSGAEADPGSNSGRGNQDKPLCERIKAVCPSGLIRFP
jgi:hypothetical protein